MYSDRHQGPLKKRPPMMQGKMQYMPPLMPMPTPGLLAAHLPGQNWSRLMAAGRLMSNGFPPQLPPMMPPPNPMHGKDNGMMRYPPPPPGWERAPYYNPPGAPPSHY